VRVHQPVLELALLTPLLPDKSAVQLSESEFLKNDVIDAVHFLENLSLREPLEKAKFFRGLPKQLPAFPAVVCTRKLLPLIASALEFGGAPAMALGCLLQARPSTL
jgi:SCY1-like protein 1